MQNRQFCTLETNLSRDISNFTVKPRFLAGKENGREISIKPTLVDQGMESGSMVDIFLRISSVLSLRFVA